MDSPALLFLLSDEESSWLQRTFTNLVHDGSFTIRWITSCTELADAAGSPYLVLEAPSAELWSEAFDGTRQGLEREREIPGRLRLLLEEDGLLEGTILWRSAPTVDTVDGIDDGTTAPEIPPEAPRESRASEHGSSTRRRVRGGSSGTQNSGRRRGVVIPVIGPSGSGVSTVAANLARTLAAEGATVLCDFKLRGELRFLLEAAPTAHGLSEYLREYIRGDASPLLERSILRNPQEELAVLLGLSSPSHWNLISAGALETLMAQTRRSFDFIVIDVGNEFSGIATEGSADIEERHLLNRAAMAAAALAVLVVQPGIKWAYTACGIVQELEGEGLMPDELALVVNGGSPWARSSSTATTIEELLRTRLGRRGDALRSTTVIPAAASGPATRMIVLHTRVFRSIVAAALQTKGKEPTWDAIASRLPSEGDSISSLYEYFERIT